MKNKSVILAAIALVVVVGVVAAVALKGNKSDTSQTSTSSMGNMNMNSRSSASSNASSAVATTSVKIENFAFSPSTIKVKVGDKVTWTNNDSVEHTVTSDSGSSNGPDSQLLARGASYSFTFTKAGTYTYHCTPHPYMKATVIVE